MLGVKVLACVRVNLRVRSIQELLSLLNGVGVLLLLLQYQLLVCLEVRMLKVLLLLLLLMQHELLVLLEVRMLKVLQVLLLLLQRWLRACKRHTRGIRVSMLMRSEHIGGGHGYICVHTSLRWPPLLWRCCLLRVLQGLAKGLTHALLHDYESIQFQYSMRDLQTCPL